MEQATRRFESEEDQPTQRMDEERAKAADRPGTCPKCGGEVREFQAGMDNQNGHLAVKRIGVWIGVLSGGVTRVRAMTCMQCGFTELYALDPAQLEQS